MARRDDIDKFISNPDGVTRDLSDYSKHTYDNDKAKFVKEESVSSKTVKENVYVEETQRVDETKTPRAESSRPKLRKPDLTFSVSNAVAAVGSTAAAAAVTVVVAVAIVVAALSLNVSLVSATAYSLSFYVDISGEENKTFTAMLSQGDMSIVYDIAQSDYLTFSDLTPDSEYNLRIIEKESGEEYFNENFCTLKNDVDRVQVKGSLSADNVLSFSLNVSNLQRDEFYTVEVTDASGKKYLVKDDTVCPQSFEVQLDKVEDAYITISINGKYALLEKVSKIHIFGEPTFSWTETDDGYSAIAVFTDVADSTYTKQIPATVTSNTTPATCETDGSIVYTASATLDGNNYTGNKTIVLSALGHDYGAPEWEWTENGGVQAGDGYTAVAVFTCSRDSHVERVDATVTSNEVAATCEVGPKVVYTATATLGGRNYTGTREDTVGQPLGHDYSGEPEWEWTETGSVIGDGVPEYAAVAIFTCTHDASHKLRVDAEVDYEGGIADCEEDGHITYYASAVYNEQNYQAEKEVTLPATGHAYGEPQWNWQESGAGGYSLVTVTFACANNLDHNVTLEANLTEEYTEPTCEDAGFMTYTATVTFAEQEYTDFRQQESGAALGHEYGEPEWEWTETQDGWTAEAVFTCSRDGHVMRLEGGDYSQEGGGEDCELPMTTVYYARVTYNDTEYEGTKEVTTPPTGHDYGTPEWEWTEVGDGQYAATAVFTCANNNEHVQYVTAENVTSEPTYEGETLVSTTYTASVEFEGETYTDTHIVPNV